ncbi:hypothetical protein AK830_g5191 [Neonectria ditissima]|uniref:Uncharacterized protein n=1 Tax=Neonectria ditissima TaxID=78410 RepID=A0A0P7AU37_9HYPO|nr:hypothetical protein AK830_g5191 [Neonectria ditissima]
MYFQRIFTTISFLFFLEPAQCIECTNVTVSTADDATQVRNDCQTIKGWLKFENVTETLNFDGVETIEGDVSHYGDAFDGYGDMDTPYPTGRTTFSIHFPTLKAIEGDLYFWSFAGLQELQFPNITRVEGGFSLRRMNWLKFLDITKLERLGSFSLEARYLTTLRHEGFKGFTGTSYNGGSLSIDAARVDSLDSWFRYPLTIKRKFQEFSPESAPGDVMINKWNLPNLKNITIGWAKTSKVWIRSFGDNGTDGDAIGVKFGGSQTKSIEIDRLELEGNVKILETGSALEKLEIGTLVFQKSPAKEANLSVFDKVTNLTIEDNGNLQNIRLPPSAVDWEDVNLSIRYNQNLTLVSEYRDPENETDKFWYWPRGDMRSILVEYTPVGNGFFTSFLQDRNSSKNASKVLDQFLVTPRWLIEDNATDFNCTPFRELRDRSVLPEEYECTAYEVSSASATTVVWGLVATALLVCGIYVL